MHDIATPPLRILHVFRAPLGGLFRHVVDLARGQATRGHEVGIFCDAIPGSAHTEELLARLAPELSLGVARAPMRRNPHLSDAVVMRRFMAHLARTKPDVVHGHGSKGGLYARASACFQGRRRPVRAYTPHGGSLNYAPGSAVHRVYMAVENALERCTDALLFESDYARRTYEAKVGRPRGALIRVVHNGLHPQEFEPVEPAPDAADFVYVGEFRPAKGLHVLLDAAEAIGLRRGRVPSIVFIGSGPDEGFLRERIAQAGHAERWRVLKPRPIREGLAMAHAILVPSLAESLPYVVLEAAAAHMPMIATDVGGIGEIFGRQRERLVSPGEAAALAAAMERMLDLSEPARRAEADALVEEMRASFTVASMVDGVVAGYRAALSARGLMLVR